MPSLSKLGIGLATVSALLFLALMAELYYLLYHRKRRRSEAAAQETTTSFFCFKAAPSSSVIASTAAPGDCRLRIKEVDEEELSVEAELMRLHGLAGPPRLLFTIKEDQAGEEVESDDGRTVRRERMSLHDLLSCAESPFLSPLPSPPLNIPSSAMDSCKLKNNPLFDTAASPPPKFKFLRDAEEKLYRKALKEEAERAQFTAIVVHREGGGGGGDCCHHCCCCHPLGSSQVAPMAASPADSRN